MVQIQLRRGDSTGWAESNPVLAPGEAAVETDTGRMKVGDGLLPWTDLDYFPSSVNSDQVIGSIPPSQVAGTAVVQTTATTKGDLLVRGTSAVERLPVGAAGTLLVPDAAASGGLAWKSLTDADVARRSQVGNLLADNVATGTDALGNTTGWSASNATLASSTATAARGSRSLEVTATGSVVQVNLTLPATRFAVTPGDTYFAMCSLYAPSVTRRVRLGIMWYDAGGSALSTSSASDHRLSATWRGTVVSATAPANAAAATVNVVRVDNFTAGEVFYIDMASAGAGVGGVWTGPGVPTVGQQPQNCLVTATASQTWSPAQPILSMDNAGTVIMPAASASAGVVATIRNNSTGAVTINRTGTDTFDGLTSISIPGKGYVMLAPNATTGVWAVLQGAYDSDTVGLASYEWRRSGTTPGWRLIGYDSGLRDITALATPAPTATAVEWMVQRGLDTMLMRMRWSDTQTNPSRVPFGTLPAGFRPATTMYLTVPYDAANTAAVRNVYLTGGGDVQYGGPTLASNFVMALVLPVTRTSLPSSLPGARVTDPS